MISAELQDRVARCSSSAWLIEPLLGNVDYGHALPPAPMSSPTSASELLSYLAKAHERTRRIVQLIPPDEFDWAPKHGWFSLGDLVRQTESQILQVKNFGKKSLQEIAALLERENLNFGMRFEETGDGRVRVLDYDTPPSRAAAAAPNDMEE